MTDANDRVLRETSRTLAAGSASLHLRAVAPTGPPVGRVLVVHGASDHGGRLRPLLRFFALRGWDAAAADLRGHGFSDGVRVHVDTFDRYIEDIDVVRREAFSGTRQGGDRLPTLLIGVSLGGLIVARYLQAAGVAPDAAALVCPLLGFGFRLPRPVLTGGRLLGRLRPRTRLWSPADGPAADGGEHRFVTAGWFRAVEAAIGDAWADRSPPRCPVGVFQAAEDRVVDPARSAAWADRLGPRATFRAWPGIGHDVFSGPARRSTANAVERWAVSAVDTARPLSRAA